MGPEGALFRASACAEVEAEDGADVGGAGVAASAFWLRRAAMGLTSLRLGNGLTTFGSVTSGGDCAGVAATCGGGTTTGGRGSAWAPSCAMTKCRKAMKNAFLAGGDGVGPMLRAIDGHHGSRSSKGTCTWGSATSADESTDLVRCFLTLFFAAGGRPRFFGTTTLESASVSAPSAAPSPPPTDTAFRGDVDATALAVVRLRRGREGEGAVTLKSLSFTSAALFQTCCSCGA